MKLFRTIHHDKIHAIAEMNFNAIRLYLQGDGRSATSTLVQALRILHQEEDQQKENFVHVSRDKNTMPIESQYFPICCLERIHTTTSISFESTGSNGGDVHMYHRPFLIEMSKGSMEMYDKAEISATLLFNLGLVHHEAGMRLGKSALLKKALILYEQGMQYLQCATNALVLMAALSNNRLNLLITYFYDIVNAKKMLNFIESILTQIEYGFVLGRTTNAVDVLYDPNSPTQSLSIQELHHFRLSLAFVKIHDLRYAPAA